jgi:hypothetical protein
MSRHSLIGSICLLLLAPSVNCDQPPATGPEAAGSAATPPPAVESVVQAQTISPPTQRTAELEADRTIRVSWVNGAIYTTVYVTLSTDERLSTPCAPPSGGLFQPGQSASCIIPSPTSNATGDTNVSFDVVGCDARPNGTGLCSPSPNLVSVFLPRPAAPTNLVVNRTANGTANVTWTNNEKKFTVSAIFIGNPEDTVSIACAPQLNQSGCVWNKALSPGQKFVAVACDNVLCSNKAGPVPLTGAIPGLTPMPLVFDWGTVSAGQPLPKATIAVKNTGTGPTGIIHVGYDTGLSDIQFDTDTCAFATLAPGATCRFEFHGTAAQIPSGGRDAVILSVSDGFAFTPCGAVMMFR